MVYKTLEIFPKGASCNLCKSREVNQINLGQIYQNGDIIVHYFCLLLSSQLVQGGTDRQGLLGFLVKDIKKEIKRGAYVKCVYCHTSGATVCCAQKKCTVKFHLPCGLKENSLHFFLDNFKSLCVKHRPKQRYPSSLLKTMRKSDCILCYTPIDLKDNYNLIWAPCCKPSSLQHKQCVQKMAYSAGYYFKCPFCANENQFVKSMRKLGIFVPEQEASWEREPRAFSDFSIELSCEARVCKCQHGRYFNRNDSKWYLENCMLCGARAIHLSCSQIWKPGADFSIEWQCRECTIISAQATTEASNNNIRAAEESNSDCNNAIAEVSSNNYITTGGNAVRRDDLPNRYDAESFKLIIEDVEMKGDELNNYSERVEASSSYESARFDSSEKSIKEEVILFVHDTDLNYALEDVSNIAEIIVNNKSCMISLKKMDYNV